MYYKKVKKLVNVLAFKFIACKNADKKAYIKKQKKNNKKTDLLNNLNLKIDKKNNKNSKQKMKN